jgi:hypothetical protein
VAKNTLPCATAGEVITAQLVIETPFLFAGRGVKRIQVRIAATGVNDAIYDRRRLKPNLIVDQRVFASWKRHFSLPVLHRPHKSNCPNFEE